MMTPNNNMMNSNKGLKQLRDLTYSSALFLFRKENKWNNDECKKHAQDAVSDAFLRYFKKSLKGEIVSNIKGYLYIIVKNIVIEKSKNFKAENIYRADYNDNDLNGAYEVEENFTDFLQSHSAKFTQKEMKIIQLLDKGYRQNEIAATMGVSNSYINKAIKKIIDKL